VGALLNAGFLRIYDGAQPATADTALGAQVLLAELEFDSPAFGAAIAGVATAEPITGEGDCPADGVAAWFRCVKADGTPVFDGSVGTSAADLVLNSTAITIHGQLSLSSLTYTQGKG
jgi:hypothetical protein